MSGAEQVEIVQAGTSARTTTLAIARLFSTAQGLPLAPLTTSERDALSSPEDGTLIYNATTNKFQGRANGVWVDLH